MPLVRGDSPPPPHTTAAVRIFPSLPSPFPQVTLESRTLTLMAPTAEAKEMWVVGINAILSGLYF